MLRRSARWEPARETQTSKKGGGGEEWRIRRRASLGARAPGAGTGGRERAPARSTLRAGLPGDSLPTRAPGTCARLRPAGPALQCARASVTRALRRPPVGIFVYKGSRANPWLWRAATDWPLVSHACRSPGSSGDTRSPSSPPASPPPPSPRSPPGVSLT